MSHTFWVVNYDDGDYYGHPEIRGIFLVESEARAFLTERLGLERDWRLKMDGWSTEYREQLKGFDVDNPDDRVQEELGWSIYSWKEGPDR